MNSSCNNCNNWYKKSQIKFNRFNPHINKKIYISFSGIEFIAKITGIFKKNEGYNPEILPTIKIIDINKITDIKEFNDFYYEYYFEELDAKTLEEIKNHYNTFNHYPEKIMLKLRGMFLTISTPSLKPDTFRIIDVLIYDKKEFMRNLTDRQIEIMKDIIYDNLRENFNDEPDEPYEPDDY